MQALFCKLGSAKNEQQLHRRKKNMAMYFSNDLTFECFPISARRMRDMGCENIIALETLAFYLIEYSALNQFGHKLRLNVCKLIFSLNCISSKNLHMILMSLDPHSAKHFTEAIRGLECQRTSTVSIGIGKWPRWWC